MKNDSKKLLMVAMGGLTLILAAGAAWAVQTGGHGRMMQHMITARVEEAEDLIDATPQQRQVIDAAKDDIVAKLQARHQARAQHKDELIAALTADKLDTDKLSQLADQHAAEIQAIAKDVIPDIQKVHDVLTPAQLQTLAAKARARHAKP
jgi:Spy/CpxP family protein refolding chaperone